MGATGSIVVSKDNNVEMNIADEAPSSVARKIQRHSSQPAGQFFASWMPRQKHGDGNVRPPVSLRSSGSFDPTSAAGLVVPSEAIDKVRKEYETLKSTKEQEIQALQRKEQKLETENNRLRAELQALNKQCQKLRADRDTAMERYYEASERAIALEQDREKIQRQFKIFRETKESEIQDLLQAKRQLESKFQRLQAHGMATIDDRNFSANDSVQQGLSSNGPLGAHSEWWAPPESETTSLFGSYAQLQNGSNVGYDTHDITRLADARQETDHDFGLASVEKEGWITESSTFSNVSLTADICDSILLRCYISATPDAVADAKMFLSHPELQSLKQACLKEGYFLSIVHLTDMEDYGVILTDNEEVLELPQHSTVRLAVSKCSVFISFVGDRLGRYTEVEHDEGHFESPGSKSVLFCLKGNGHNYSTVCRRFQQRIQASSCKKIFDYSSPFESCNAALKEIMKAVRLEFGVKLQDNTAVCSGVEPCEVTCIEDMMMDPHMELMQQEIALMSTKPDQVKTVGLEKSYSRLDEVVTSPGPVPPLLVSGTSGSGKTLLLSSWMCRLRNSRLDVIILSHFISSQKAVDADPVILLRRLLLQLRQHLPNGTYPPTQSYSTFDVTRLRETLPRWLEQLSSRCNKRILLVIDSLDLLKDTQRHFNWLLDPLHVGVRVVVSVGVDSCPEEWRQFPTLHLEPLSVQSVKTLLKEHTLKRNVTLSQQWERDVISQCRTATTCHPLYITLLSVLVCSVYEGHVSEKLFYSCTQTRDSIELYRLFLREVEVKSSNRETRNQFKAIVQFIVCSPSGLSETEILSLVPDMTWYTWTSHICKLTTLCIIKEQAGFFVPHNSEVTTVLYDTYVGNEVHERRCHQKMLTWLQRCHAEQVTPRSTDLLLWLLHEDEEREDLLKILKSPLVFHSIYTRGHTSKLVGLWNFLNEEKHAIAEYYKIALRQMENTSSNQKNNQSNMTETAKIYESLGRFLKDMGLMEEAVSALQRSVEILETFLDPDHPAVADSLHHLASVYAQWGKLATAEPLYRQSLELVESTAGRDHLRVAQELSALVRVARKTGRQEYADTLQQRITAITQRNGQLSLNRLERLKKRALRLEELTLGEDTLEMAQALNDLGVLYHLQNNLENAESFFKRSLKIREKLVGKEDTNVAQSLQNLASVHNERKQYVNACQCMTEALQIRRKTLGETDNTTITTIKYLAILYKKMKDQKKASETYKKLLHITMDTAGENSIATANALVNSLIELKYIYLAKIYL